MAFTVLNEYKPDYTVSPGEILEETLEARGMKKSEFAERCGMSAKTISLIINGKAPVLPDSAIQFERVLNVSASLWNNLESSYRLFLAREKDRRLIQAKIDWIKNFPIKDLVKLNFLHKSDSQLETIRKLLDFFGVGSIKIWESRFKNTEAVFRESKSFNRDPVATVTWLRIGEKLAEKSEETIEYNDFNKTKFRDAVKEIRKMTPEKPEIFCPEIEKKFAKAGVIVVFFPELKGIKLFGATKWITPNRPLIMHSLRLKSNDQFWFTLFHEAAHIILHGKKEEFLDDAESEKTYKEMEADSFAANLLIPKSQYEKYLNSGKINRETIIEFADRISIAPGIVVGRLQHDKIILFNQYNYLKKKYGFEVS